MVFVERDITPNDPIRIELDKFGNPMRAIVEKDGKVWEMGMGGSEGWIREEAKIIAKMIKADVRMGPGVGVTNWKPGTPVYVTPHPTQIWTERLNLSQTGGKR